LYLFNSLLTYLVVRAKDILFYQSIVNILKVAGANPSFTQTFWYVIEGAGEICGDRMALSILDLHIAKQLMDLNPQNHLQVAAFLRQGAWPYALLKEHAIQKVVLLEAEHRRRARALGRDPNEYSSFDEIEVHLGYPIKLREALHLPIAAQEMLYFTCSCLTDDDLDKANTSVRKKIESDEEFITYLIDQDKWTETLKAKHPNELTAIEATYEPSEAEDPNEPKAIKDASLKQLTRELLQEPENQAITSVKRRRVGARELKALHTSPDVEEDAGEGRRKMVKHSFIKAPK
jgi:hypothetical protein